MNTAILDLGTNTFNLLVRSAEGALVFSDKLAVRLGAGGLRDGVITPEAEDRAVAAVALRGQPAAAGAAGQGATTPVADLLTRMEAVEAQLKRLTAQGEENANRLAQHEHAIIRVHRRDDLAVGALGLAHVVITSVTRDDLPDGGAEHYYQCVLAVRARTGATIP